MSSSMITCIGCQERFDVADYPLDLVHPVVRELPWTCPHCGVQIDFNDRDKRWEGMKILDNTNKDGAE